MPTGVKPPPPNDSLRVAFEGQYGETTWAVVHWFQLSSIGAATQAQLDTLVDSIGAAFGSNILNEPWFSPRLVLTRLVARYRLQSGAGSMRSIRVADVVGTSTAIDAPAQVAYLLNWNTIDDRRGGKPRSYIPGVPADRYMNDASINPTTVTALTSGANAYIAAVLALTSGPLHAPQMVEMSFVSGKAYRAAAVTFDIQSGSCNAFVATQRRRVDRLRG